MKTATRFGLWLVAAVVALGTDVITKAQPHTTVAHNYSHTPAILLITLAACLCVLGIGHSRMLAVGAGLMFGGLCGNGGQLLAFGYASDWLPIGGWLTNAADIFGFLGITCCGIGYLYSGLQSLVEERSSEGAL
jgi:hypothetical protein